MQKNNYYSECFDELACAIMLCYLWHSQPKKAQKVLFINTVSPNPFLQSSLKNESTYIDVQ